jgi:hypothetical protein
MANYEEALAKPFTDIKNLIIGIILSMIPIVNFTVVFGYFLESSGLGKSKPSKKLPEWKDWTYLFVKGVAVVFVTMIYLIPAAIVVSLGLALTIAQIAQVLVSASVTPEFLSQLQMGTATVPEIQAVFARNWYLIMPEILRMAPVFIAGFILAVLAGYMVPMALLNYLSKKSFGAAFDISAVMRKTFNLKYLVAWIVLIVLGILVSGILSVVPLVGRAAAVFVVGVISYTIYGQLYKEIK